MINVEDLTKNVLASLSTMASKAKKHKVNTLNDLEPYLGHIDYLVA